MSTKLEGRVRYKGRMHIPEGSHSTNHSAPFFMSHCISIYRDDILMLMCLKCRVSNFIMRWRLCLLWPEIYCWDGAFGDSFAFSAQIGVYPERLTPADWHTNQTWPNCCVYASNAFYGRSFPFEMTIWKFFIESGGKLLHLMCESFFEGCLPKVARDSHSLLVL